MKTTDRNGSVVATLQVTEESDVMIITNTAKSSASTQRNSRAGRFHARAFACSNSRATIPRRRRRPPGRRRREKKVNSFRGAIFRRVLEFSGHENFAPLVASYFCCSPRPFCGQKGQEHPHQRKKIFCVAGTYTQKTQRKGIYAFRYEPRRQAHALGVAAETPDPSFVAIHPSGKFLYAVNEGGKSSFVTSFALDAKAEC